MALPRFSVRLPASCLVAGLALLATAGAATDKKPSGESGAPPARVMVLGTYHFANPGRDVMNVDAGDILSEKKQREVVEVVEALAAFEPTKIMVEARDQTELDQEYSAYVAGERELEANETDQLGYRLAKRLGLERVWAVDVAGPFDFEKVLAWAQENDPEFVETFRAFRERFEATHATLPLRHSVREALRIENDPETLEELNGLYPQIAEVGAGENWIGADLVTDWHGRNIRIFGLIGDITEPGDRVLVIFGSGHKATLDYMVGHAPEMEPVSPLDYM